MIFSRTVLHHSRVMPGVVVKLRRFTHGSRAQLRLELTGVLDEIRKLRETAELESAKFNLTEPTDSFTVDQRMALDRIMDVSNKIEAITATSIDPIYLKYAVQSVEGLVDDQGQPFNAQTLYAEGPEELCVEVLKHVKQLAGLQSEDKENFELPTTSGGQVDGQAMPSIVSNATSESPIETATVIDISKGR